MVIAKHTAKRILVALIVASLLSAFAPTAALAQTVLLKDIARVQGVTSNQLVGYGIVVGLNQTGDSTRCSSPAKRFRTSLQTFGLDAPRPHVRTRERRGRDGDRETAAVRALRRHRRRARLVDGRRDEPAGRNAAAHRAARRRTTSSTRPRKGPISVGGFSAGHRHRATRSRELRRGRPRAARRA